MNVSESCSFLLFLLSWLSIPLATFPCFSSRFPHIRRLLRDRRLVDRLRNHRLRNHRRRDRLREHRLRDHHRRRVRLLQVLGHRRRLPVDSVAKKEKKVTMRYEYFEVTKSRGKKMSS